MADDENRTDQLEATRPVLHRPPGGAVNPRFGRVLTAMVTPFDDSGELDLGAASEVAQFLVETGSDGLVLAGTTGESPTLTDSEAAALFRRVRESVEVPLLAGAGSNSSAHAVELTKMAADCGVDGILSVTPYYNRPPQSGLMEHFCAVAAATTLPVMIYDIPIRTGRKVETSTLLALVAECDNIVAVKDAAGDPVESARLIAGAPDGFELYSGDDAMTLPLLSVGAVGVVSVASHWAAAQMGEMVDSYHKGDVIAARRLNSQLAASFDFESSADAPNPMPTKAMMRVLGLRVGGCRPPMTGDPADLESRARAVLDGLA
ncbi:MAG: 4-hydroxy-tetrahydrodipicolinate synthase [Microthrixaceae bacterium]